MRTNRRKQPDRSTTKHSYPSIALPPISITVQNDQENRINIIENAVNELHIRLDQLIRERIESADYSFNSDQEYRIFFADRCRIIERSGSFRELFIDYKCIATWNDVINISEEKNNLIITLGGKGH